MNKQIFVRLDHVFAENASNQEVFDVVAKNVVDHAIAGYNGAILVYGQTGSGKYTCSYHTY